MWDGLIGAKSLIYPPLKKKKKKKRYQTFEQTTEGKARTVRCKLAVNFERNNYQAHYKRVGCRDICSVSKGHFLSKKNKNNIQTQARSGVRLGAAHVWEHSKGRRTARGRGRNKKGRTHWGVNKLRKGRRDGRKQEREAGEEVIKNGDKAKNWEQRRSRERGGERDWFTNSGVLSQVHALRQAGCLFASDRTACVCANTLESLSYTHSPINTLTHTHTHIERRPR